MYDSGNPQPTPSTAVTITPANCPCTLWPSSAVPWDVDVSDPNSIEVGTKFYADLSGSISALRFYKAAANTGTHTGHLWTASGTLLGSLTFTGETASGWQQASFATAIPITAGTTYVASYHTNVGHYSENSYYFGVSGVDQWPLHAPASPSVAGGTGVYIYGASASPPDVPRRELLVDVVIGPLDTTPPTVSITAPTNGAAVSGNVTVSATASDNVAAFRVRSSLDGANLGAEDTTSLY